MVQGGQAGEIEETKHTHKKLDGMKQLTVVNRKAYQTKKWSPKRHSCKLFSADTMTAYMFALHPAQLGS